MKNKKRNLIVFIVIIVILMMSVAYAAVTRTLLIDGTAKVSGNVGVKITNITTGTFTGGAANTNTPSFTNTTATFDVTLSEPGETATYVITIENKGNVPAVLSGINYKVGSSINNISTVTNLNAVNSANPSGIEFQVVEPPTTVLEVDGRTTCTVIAKWNSTATNLNVDSAKIMTMELIYEQSR